MPDYFSVGRKWAWLRKRLTGKRVQCVLDLSILSLLYVDTVVYSHSVVSNVFGCIFASEVLYFLFCQKVGCQKCVVIKLTIATQVADVSPIMHKLNCHRNSWSHHNALLQPGIMYKIWHILDTVTHSCLALTEFKGISSLHRLRICLFTCG